MDDELTPKAKLEREIHEEQHGWGIWPPTLPAPDITFEKMLEWHEQGCEWPVGGDEIVIATSKDGKRA